jgi:hypothetical protein
LSCRVPCEPFPILLSFTVSANNHTRNKRLIGTATRIHPVAHSRSVDGDASSVDGEDKDKNDAEENDDQPKSKHILKACLESHADAIHGFKGATKKWRNNVTPGFILVFFVIICILGATTNWNANFLYWSTYHKNNPMVQKMHALEIISSRSNGKLHHPQKIQPVDKSMIKCMGGVFPSCSTCLPTKPIKHGIKVYSLCPKIVGPYFFGRQSFH